MCKRFSLLRILLFSGLILVWLASAASANVQFNGFQQATYLSGTTTIHLKIHQGNPSQQIIVIWEKPADAEVKRDTVQLNTSGEYVADWIISTVTVTAGERDRFRIRDAAPGGITLAFDHPPGGIWVATKAGLNRQNPNDPNTIPTLSEWALILFAAVIIGLITFYFVRQRSHLRPAA